MKTYKMSVKVDVNTKYEDNIRNVIALIESLSLSNVYRIKVEEVCEKLDGDD